MGECRTGYFHPIRKVWNEREVEKPRSIAIEARRLIIEKQKRIRSSPKRFRKRTFPKRSSVWISGEVLRHQSGHVHQLDIGVRGYVRVQRAVPVGGLGRYVPGVQRFLPARSRVFRHGRAGDEEQNSGRHPNGIGRRTSRSGAGAGGEHDDDDDDGVGDAPDLAFPGRSLPRRTSVELHTAD